MGSKGSKVQRQNQHVKRLEKKIKRFKKSGRNTAGLEKELGFMSGEDRPAFKSGREVNPKYKKSY
jgi:hypothetical protein